MEAQRAQNLVLHDDEIRSRPARSWYQSTKEKREAQKMSREDFEVKSGSEDAVVRKKKRELRKKKAEEEGGERQGDDGGLQRRARRKVPREEAPQPRIGRPAGHQHHHQQEREVLLRLPVLQEAQGFLADQRRGVGR